MYQLILSSRFVHARDSRSKLYTTREMMMLCLTYLQSLPEFIDFLFPFGQRTAKDLHFSAFRHRTRLSAAQQGLAIKELGWSGRDLHVCYNFKSVERSSSQSQWPWSIRHCAINHSFDVVNIRSSWVMIKGDRAIQKRILAATSDRGPPEFRDFRTIDRAYAATLAVHLILCNWSMEDWRWYNNFLEEKLQEISGRAIANEIEVPPTSPISETNGISSLSRTATDMTEKSILSRISRRRTQTWGTLSSINENHPGLGLRINTTASLGPPQSPNTRGDAPGSAPAHDEGPKYDLYGQQEFSFGDLQQIHHIDKRANEAALVIAHNLNVLTQLAQYYRTVYKSKAFPDTIKDKCDEDMQAFEMQIQSIEMDLRLQASRLEMILRLAADCKLLVARPTPSLYFAANE